LLSEINCIFLKSAFIWLVCFLFC